MIILRNLCKTRMLRITVRAGPREPAGDCPSTPILTKQTYATPMSYIASTQRIFVWADKPRSTALAIRIWTASVLGSFLPSC